MTHEQDTPSYEDLLKRPGGINRGSGKWQRQLKDLEPGEVLAPVLGETTSAYAQRAVLLAAKALGIKVVTRIRDDVLYVIRLRDEDIPNA